MPGRGTQRRYEDVPTAPVERDLAFARRSRRARRAFLSVLLVFVLLGLGTVLGARTAVVRASGGGYDLRLAFPAMTRPGLAIRWILTIHRAGGFQEEIAVATDSDYFNLFDFNNVDPTPATVTTTSDLSIWTFDPPPGDTFRITLDARLEPARQHGSIATTSILEGGRPVVTLRYQTRVMP